MADIRINALATTAASTASDDFVAVDGSANGTRKLNAYSPTFGGNLTVSGTGTSSFAGAVTIANTASTSSYQTGLRLQSTAGSAPNTIQALEFYSSSLSTAVGAIDALREAGSFASSLRFYSTTSGGALTERGRFNSSGNLLLKSDGVDSGNGRLQLADHNTSAGGIGFGTDWTLSRDDATNFALYATGGSSATFALYLGGVKRSSIGTDGTTTYIGSRGVGYSTILMSGNGSTALTLDSSQNATFAGKITANGAGSTFKGTATNDNAAAGYVGEFVSSIIASGSAVSLTTNTITNVTSISLTAGDWDVFGAVDFIPEATTLRTRSIGAVSTTSASLPATYYRNTLTLGTTDANAETYGGPTPVQRISISSTTTVYLVAFATFSVGTQTAHGYIQARRVR